MRYPDTPTCDQVDDYHGTKIRDPYRWLEDTDSEQTRAWVQAQNDVTRAWLAQVTSRQDIRERLTALWDHPRAGAPWHREGRWFQLRNTGLQNQDVLWSMDAPDAEGRVLLDPNTLSEDGTVALTGAAVSDDGELLAYATSEAGSDWMTWRVREVGTGEDRADVIRWSKFSGAAWTRDGAGFYYAHYDPPQPGAEYEQRNLDQKLSYHRLGTEQGEDELVYARPDEPEWGFSPSVTDDGRYLVVHVWQGTDPRNRIYLANLDRGGRVEPLIDDFDAGYDLIGSHGDVLLFRTDLDAPLGRVIAVDVTRPHREHWEEVVPEGEDRLERARLVGGRIVAAYLHHASHRIRLFGLDGEPAGEVALPGYGSVDAITGRPEDQAFHFTFTTFTAPTAVYRHDIPAHETALVRAPGADIDASAFRTQQVFVTSKDGTRVPMFLVCRADVTPDGSRPTLLYGYGGFDIALTPAFAVSRHVWVERGGVLAIANLRGGGEYGKAWHDAGRLANKQNVFDDAIACAEWLVQEGWTSARRLAIQGGSNGGLLVGACMTQRPDLFGACVPEVGVLDMLRFHRFTIGWGWTSDYGCADDPEQFAWLHAYSPLHNLRPGTAYPATLVTTGDHDDRVVPGHSFKFAAALQAAQGGDAPVLIRIETQAGHGAGKPTGKLIDERTDVLAFLERALGVEEP
jgi:prolyl oligopeptidase